MDLFCLSSPPKILTDDKLRPVRKHTPRIAAVAVGVAVGLYVQLINIEWFSLNGAIHFFARAVLYKGGAVVLSSTLI